METAGLAGFIVVAVTTVSAGLVLIFFIRKIGQFFDQLTRASEIAEPANFSGVRVAGGMASNESYAADNAWGNSSKVMRSGDINPATGLPMVAGIGSFEVASNPLGSGDSFTDGTHGIDINPTTGLPMVNGVGGVDVGGNVWCCISSLFDSLGHGTSSVSYLMDNSTDIHSLADNGSPFDSFNND